MLSRLGDTVLILLMIACFALGRYHKTYETSKSETTKSEAKTKEKDKKVTVIIENPDGKKTTTITEESERETKEGSTHKRAEAKELERKQILNISALAGVDYSEDKSQILYGVSVTKQFIGPFTLGLFGLNNGTVGVSVGSNF